MMERMVSQRVDELNRAYTTLEKLDENKSTFIQVAAHELRTPLTIIKGYLGILREHAAIKNNEALIEAANGVMQGADRLHKIVNSMLDVARLESQVIEPRMGMLSIAPLLRLLHKEFQKDLETRNITLVMDEDLSTLPPLKVDPELFQKALIHIVVNAIKFTPDGGRVTIHVEAAADEHLGPCIDIQVQDTGIGIDPANLDIVFEKLYQLGKVDLHSSGRTTFKGGGPGLGLAIAAGIVKAHGGKIWAESPGHDEEKLPGSTFYIRLPAPRD
jgi:signal transduction histidine kinase